MSDDSFIREVNEELRREKARALWGRYGPFLIGAAVAIVLATGVWQLYSVWSTNKRQDAGDQYMQLVTLAEQRNDAALLDALKQFSDNAPGGYPDLAHMLHAALVYEQGDVQQALTEYKAVADDQAIPETLRDVARLRAAYILIDHGTYAEVEQLVASLIEEQNAIGFQAHEALGLAAYKSGDMTAAHDHFKRITDAQTADQATLQRAQLMLELIQSAPASDKV